MSPQKAPRFSATGQVLSEVAWTSSHPSVLFMLQSEALTMHAGVAQRPAMQALPDPHAVPQLPQFAPSVCRSTPRPLHTLCPEGQLTAQVPLPHTCPEAQVVLHAPQLALSLRVFTSQPLAALPSQSAKPALHAPMAQPPARHTAVALARGPHARPHAPQWSTLLESSASQPLSARPSQSA